MKLIWGILFAAVAVGASLGTLVGRMSAIADQETRSNERARVSSPNPLPVPADAMLPHPDLRNPSTGSSLNTPPTEQLRHGIWRRTEVDAPLLAGFA